MKVVVFVMILAWQGGMAPPHEEKMDSLEECLKRVESSVKDFQAIENEHFNFVAGCRIESRKLDPV